MVATVTWGSRGWGAAWPCWVCLPRCTALNSEGRQSDTWGLFLKGKLPQCCWSWCVLVGCGVGLIPPPANRGRPHPIGSRTKNREGLSPIELMYCHLAIPHPSLTPSVIQSSSIHPPWLHSPPPPAPRCLVSSPGLSPSLRLTHRPWNKKILSDRHYQTYPTATMVRTGRGLGQASGLLGSILATSSPALLGLSFPHL